MGYRHEITIYFCSGKSNDHFFLYNYGIFGKKKVSKQTFKKIFGEKRQNGAKRETSSAETGVLL